MSEIKVNAITDASGGNTTTVNSVTPSTHTVKGRNLIINGAMEVAQRGTSHTTSVSTGYHTVDRIDIGGSSNVGQWTTSQDSDAPDGFTKSFKVECTTADTSFASTDHYGIMYMPEGHHMNPVGKGTSGAKSMTLSFYMKANVSKTMVVELTDAGNARHVNFAVTPSATNTWERIILNIPADTSGGFNAGTNSIAGELNFWLAAGTNYTSGSNQSTWTARTAANIVAGVSNWADTVGNAIWITGLQLELGNVATEFDHRSFGEELALCQRYFFNPLFGRTTGSIYYPIHFNQVSTGNNGLLRWQVTFPVSMRSSPSFTHSLTDAKFQTSAPNGTDNWAFYRQNSGWSAKAGNSDISVLNIAPSVNQGNVGAYYVTPNDTLATAIAIGGGATFNFSSEL